MITHVYAVLKYFFIAAVDAKIFTIENNEILISNMSNDINDFISYKVKS